MEGIILISLISYIDMMLMIVYMYKGPGHWKLLWQVWLPRQILLLLYYDKHYYYDYIMIIFYYFYHWSRTSFARQFTGEELNRGANATLDVWLDIVAWGFWERQRSAFFDVRVCHLNADSYRDLDPDEIFRQPKTEKKSQSMPVECTAEQT